MKEGLKKIAVIIPCHNEEGGIAEVINDMPIESLKEMGFETEIIVIDNNSDDNTAEVCKALNVRVVFEGKKGKGNAIRTGFNAICDDTDYVVMLDGDNTYKAKEMPRLIEPLASDFCDVIVGSRLGGKMLKDSFRFQNRAANWVFTFLVRVCYKANVTDVLSGYFAWKKSTVDKLKGHLESEGFSIEMEMITKMVKLGFTMFSVPITYDARIGETKLSAVKDGFLILFTLGRHIFWQQEIPQKLPARVLAYNNEQTRKEQKNSVRV